MVVDVKHTPADGLAPSSSLALSFRRFPPVEAVLATLLFLAFATLFFLLIGKHPATALLVMVEGAFGSGYAFSETLVKCTPILFCALATLLPARLGLTSVGAEGQLFIGSIAGTAVILYCASGLGLATLPVVLLAAAGGAAAWGLVAGVLRAYLNVNETISTLLLNYVAPLLVSFLVYGPWKDPDSLGWPSTIAFPDAARLPTYFETRVHFGLFLAVGLTFATWFVLRHTRWGFYLDLLESGPILAQRAGLRFSHAALWVMAVGAAFAGMAGIAEATVIEGRLQAGVGAGAGYSGFLVAWLARGRILRLLPLSLLLGALIAAGDNLQLFEDLPSSVSYVLQALVFISGLLAAGLVRSNPVRVG